MPDTLWYDSETFSATPIKFGTYRYAADAEIMLVPYAIDDEPPKILDLTEDPDAIFELIDLLENSRRIIAHNAMFDRSVLKYGELKLDIPIERWRCSMAKAYAHALPGGLDKLCTILGVSADLAKLADGKALIRLFCMPRPKNMKLRRATRLTHPTEWARFKDYAVNDISAMREVWRKLPSWNYSDDPRFPGGVAELALWHRDQAMNDRGVPVDMALIEGAIRACEEEKTSLQEEMAERTNGIVDKATQRDKLLDFIFAEYGMGLEDLTKSTVKRLVEDTTIDPLLRELLEIRQQASKTSTSKFKAFQRASNSDHRVRGMIQFAGASRTRRDAGRTVQLQNLASRNLPEQEEIDAAVDAFREGYANLIYDNVMVMASACVRAAIQASRGRKFCVADLANIEGRGLAWLAGESWKIQAFKDYDTLLTDDYGTVLVDDKGEPLRKGPDLYKLAYAKSFSISPAEVTKYGRSVGKVMELMLGYEGGIGAYITGAVGYDIDLEDMANTAWEVLPPDIIAESEDFLDWWDRVVQRPFPISNKARIVCESFKRLWRYAHPKTVELWKVMKKSFTLATQNPGTTFEYERLKFRRDGIWLRIQLPSGRCLCYPRPEVDDKGQCSYMGINQFNRKWQRIKTHGGKLTENAIQSMSRDILFDRLPAVEDAGYLPIVRVHDEVVTETPDADEYTGEGLVQLLSVPPAWATGFPLAAAGFEDYRYRK